ncbi:MAG TPA: rhomboid family intramembrane serine protease [Polyangia bacterium]|nr:rhomboid family intramembrane serine protease [Polyangia bacterium]
MLIPLRDHNPRQRAPVVTVSLIVVNVLVFLYELFSPPAVQKLLILSGGAIPVEIVNLIDLPPRNILPVPGSIWTSMFLHGGWLHLIGNMWFLWIFGDNVEEALGRARYLLFYFLVGTVGALAQCFTMPESASPMIGASGAVAGALGGYVLLYPRAKIVTLVLWFFVDVPAWIFLGLWFVSQFYVGEGSGVAWMAHVGGFLAGIGLVRLLAPRRRKRPPLDAEYLPPGRW